MRWFVDKFYRFYKRTLQMKTYTIIFFNNITYIITLYCTCVVHTAHMAYGFFEHFIYTFIRYKIYMTVGIYWYLHTALYYVHCIYLIYIIYSAHNSTPTQIGMGQPIVKINVPQPGNRFSGFLYIHLYLLCNINIIYICTILLLYIILRRRVSYLYSAVV